MATARRPIYLIAHRCNDVSDIGAALEKGANAIECDVRYGRPTILADYDWYVDHDGVYAWSTTLSEWLDQADKCAKSHDEDFALIIFDIKTPEKLSKFRGRVRDGLPVSLNVLFTMADYSDREAFGEIDSGLRFNEGLAIDEDNDPNRVQRYFVGEGVANFWYGNGIFVGGIGPNVRPSLVKAARYRDDGDGIKKIYVWTLAKDSSIRDYIEDVTVDGIMVNQSTIEDAVDIIEGSGARKATRFDLAFGRFSAGETGVLSDYPRSIVGNWTGWPDSFRDGVDAALYWPPKAKGYFFRGADYVRFTPGKGVDGSYPRRIADNWEGWPASFDRVDAALFWPSKGKGYFFRGDEYLRYTPGKGVDSNYPRLIADHWDGWPEDFTNLDAAVFWPPKGKAYFFKGGDYLRYTPGSGVDSGYPKRIADHWTNWPADFTGVNGACFWENGYGYFFDGSKYLKYRPK